MSTAAVHSFLQTAGAVAKAKIKNQDLDPVSLVLTLVQSAFTGQNIGATITDQVLQKHIFEHASRIIELVRSKKAFRYFVLFLRSSERFGVRSHEETCEDYQE